MEDREQLLRQDVFLIAIVTLSLVNGMEFSPWYEPSFILMRPLLASLGISSPLLTLYFSSLIVAVGAALIAGVPAAIYERVTGRTQSDARSMGLWLLCTFVVSLPAFARLFGGR